MFPAKSATPSGALYLFCFSLIAVLAARALTCWSPDQRAALLHLSGVTAVGVAQCWNTFARHSRRSAATLHGQIWKPDISAPPAFRFSCSQQQETRRNPGFQAAFRVSGEIGNAEGAACSLVALAYKTGACHRSSGLFGAAWRCLFLLPLGEGGPKDRMRGGGLCNCQDRQLYPLTPTLSQRERGQFGIGQGYRLTPSTPLAAMSCSQPMPSCTASGSPHMSGSGAGMTAVLFSSLLSRS